jgi:hypothetical protein
MSLLQLWPLFAYIGGLFFGGIGVAVGLVMWIMGRLSEQDARRIELKEAVLHEVRLGNKEIFDKIDSLTGRLNELSMRLTRVETVVNLHRVDRSASRSGDD